MHLETSPPLTCTIAVAAKSLGISRRQIYRLIQRGTLRKVKAGRRSLVPEADVRAFARGVLDAPQILESETAS
ncbi:helix-turn-helix domain-containing protein [Sphingomonas faeni]|uniref:helix-turn-helix domain-containing protein n=1 Tax=Sphingomonas faeni TaxID=185950 RepID=UPI0027810F2C|nr:excisionase family DNA binding protein [Sphingomonas faeni]